MVEKKVDNCAITSQVSDELSYVDEGNKLKRWKGGEVSQVEDRPCTGHASGAPDRNAIGLGTALIADPPDSSIDGFDANQSSTFG